VPDGSVREQLLRRIDELVARMATLLEDIRAVTEQLHPERARSCRNAITMASVMTTRSAYGPMPVPSTIPDSEAYVPDAIWGSDNLRGRPPGLPVLPGGRFAWSRADGPRRRGGGHSGEPVSLCVSR
jgi:CubicO group peptidase (beta-lactamase class C family)